MGSGGDRDRRLERSPVSVAHCPHTPTSSDSLRGHRESRRAILRGSPTRCDSGHLAGAANGRARSCIARIVKRIACPRMEQRTEDHVTLVRSGADPAGEEQALLAEVFHRGGCRAGAPERFEEQSHGVLDLRVRIAHDPVERISYTRPMGRGTFSSPRFALLQIPPWSPARST